MDSYMKNFVNGSFCPEDSYAQQAIARCPILRNINEPTNFSFSSLNFVVPVQGAKGPIFEDEPDFDMAFRRCNGVVPLSNRSFMQKECKEEPQEFSQFNPLAAKAATISLSSFGSGGFFEFDVFNKKFNKAKQNTKPFKQDPSSKKGANSSHEAVGNEWLQTGQCPIAKSYQAVGEWLQTGQCHIAKSYQAVGNEWLQTGQCPIAKSYQAVGNEWLQTGQCPIAKSYRAIKAMVPLVAEALKPPPGMKFKCPPAIVAACTALVNHLRPQPLHSVPLVAEALKPPPGMKFKCPPAIVAARTALVNNLRPQPLHSKMLAIAMLGMAANVPLGVWREHTQKFSPQWFVAILAAVPFIAMAFTIAASILGQTIGSRAERMRMKAVANELHKTAAAAVCKSEFIEEEKQLSAKNVLVPNAEYNFVHTQIGYKNVLCVNITPKHD